MVPKGKDYQIVKALCYGKQELVTDEQLLQQKHNCELKRILTLWMVKSLASSKGEKPWLRSCADFGIRNECSTALLWFEKR